MKQRNSKQDLDEVLETLKRNDHFLILLFFMGCAVGYKCNQDEQTWSFSLSTLLHQFLGNFVPLGLPLP